jgi:xanthine dehydrogenase/oxidase
MVDVGQIEGSFVMGMGYWLTEELIHDPDTGRLLNTRTWVRKFNKFSPLNYSIYP